VKAQPPYIHWTPWEDPLESIKKKDKDNEYDFDDTPKKVAQSTPGLWNQYVGFVPLDEGKSLSSAFNWWVGNSNFNVTKTIHNIIKKVEGVERLNILSRYRFMLAVGQVFDAEEVKREVQRQLYEYRNNKLAPRK
jgi:hypothetical protein